MTIGSAAEAGGASILMSNPNEVSACVTVTVPPGSDSGRRLRLRGKGIADPQSGARGDLYVTVQIRVPVGLDPEASAKLRELAAYDPPGIRKEWDS